MIHCNTPFGRILKFLVVLLLSLSALVVGLLAFNIDVMQMEFVRTNLTSFVRPLQIAVGIAGVLGLISLVACLGHGCAKCDSGHSHGSHTHK